MSTSPIDSVLSEIRRLSAELKVAGESEAQASGAEFEQALKQALDAVNEAQNKSEEARNAYTLGDEKLALSDVMIAQQKARIAFEATLRVRNHLVSAYQEIMNMPL